MNEPQRQLAIPLRREDLSVVPVPYLFIGGFIVGSGMLAILPPALFGGAEVVREWSPALFLGVWAGVVALAIAALLLVRRRHRAMPPPVIEIGPGARLAFPIGAFRPRVIVLAPEHVLRVAFLETTRMAVLLIDTDRGTLAYPARRFIEPAHVIAVRDALRGMLALLPDGAQRLAESATAESHAQEALARTARRPVTASLTALLATIFVLEVWLQDAERPVSVLALGANIPLLIRAGEYYRVVTASFLHIGRVHILVNGLSLMSLGGLIETLVGPWRMLLIYLISGIAGAAASAMADRAVLSAGASTAVFGLLGGLAAIELLHRAEIPIGFRVSTGGWVMTLVVNGALPFLIPQIDWVAHLGGFAGGALVGLVVGRSGFTSSSGRSLPMKVAVLAVVALHLVAFVLCVQRAVDGPSERVALKLATMSDRARPEEAEVLNEVAYLTACRHDAGERANQAARTLAVKALELAEDEREKGMVQDTLALIEARLGRLDDAVRLQIEAHERIPEHAGIATQLAKFLRTRGPRVEDEVSLIRQPDGGVDVVAPGPMRLYAVVSRDEELAGLLDVCAVPGADGKAHAPEVEGLPRSRRIELHEAQGTDTCTTTATGAATPRFYAPDPRVLELP